MGSSEFLDALASTEAREAGGSAAAYAAAAAAALVELAARFARDWPEADAAAGRARALRARAEEIVAEDAESYAVFLKTRSDAARERTIDLPLEVAGIAAELGGLAVEAAERGNPNLAGDATAAALLAEAAARIASNLVRLNGAAGERLARAGRLAAEATRTAARCTLRP